MTSPSNVAVVENHDVHLECHAVGKPAPNVHWYRINENGYTIGKLLILMLFLMGLLWGTLFLFVCFDF